MTSVALLSTSPQITFVSGSYFLFRVTFKSCFGRSNIGQRLDVKSRVVIFDIVIFILDSLYI